MIEIANPPPRLVALWQARQDHQVAAILARIPPLPKLLLKVNADVFCSFPAMLVNTNGNWQNGNLPDVFQMFWDRLGRAFTDHPASATDEWQTRW